MIEKADFKGRLRIVGAEINGHDSVAKALANIKGIGTNMSVALSKLILKELKIDADEMIGNLTDAQLEKIEDLIRNPTQLGVPTWMLNRKRDPETGADRHLIASDLDFVQKNDIKQEIEVRSIRGIRHSLGLTVRGQRTRTSGRKGLSLGVQRQKAAPAKAGDAAKAPAKKK